MTGSIDGTGGRVGRWGGVLVTTGAIPDEVVNFEELLRKYGDGIRTVRPVLLFSLWFGRHSLEPICVQGSLRSATTTDRGHVLFSVIIRVFRHIWEYPSLALKGRVTLDWPDLKFFDWAGFHICPRLRLSTIQ